MSERLIWRPGGRKGREGGFEGRVGRIGIFRGIWGNPRMGSGG